MTLTNLLYTKKRGKLKEKNKFFQIYSTVLKIKLKNKNNFYLKNIKFFIYILNFFTLP
jgi:hypothetical protein